MQFSGAFFWIIMFRIMLANINPIFIELKRFSSLFVVKFQASILYESHHLLVKLSCKADYENLDGLRSRSAVCFLQPILQLCKNHWAFIMTAFFIFTRFWYMLTHVQSKPSNNLALDTDSRSWSTFYKTCARRRCESFPIFERLGDVCSW